MLGLGVGEVEAGPTDAGVAPATKSQPSQWRTLKHGVQEYLYSIFLVFWWNNGKNAKHISSDITRRHEPRYMNIGLQGPTTFPWTSKFFLFVSGSKKMET